MPRGGKRPGAGRPEGSKQPQTLAREAYQEAFKRVAGPYFQRLIDAAVQAGLGVTHLMAKDSKTGQWVQVTDPDIMVKVLNSGESFYKLSARNPDTRALKDIFDRMCGSPTQAIDLNVGGEIELVERLSQARKRGKG
jgi:hypothetical protein